MVLMKHADYIRNPYLKSKFAQVHNIYTLYNIIFKFIYNIIYN